eukprot:5712061-Amphidinium_carterae.2
MSRQRQQGHPKRIANTSTSKASKSAGKRTHSSRLAHRFALHYISIGDLLWDEQSKPESPYAEEVRVALNSGHLNNAPPTQVLRV